MADATFKVMIGFEASGGTAPTGWSEVFYDQGSDIERALDKAKDYAKKRKALLGKGAVVQFAKITNLPPNRQSRIYFFVGKEGQPDLFTNSPEDDYDPTQVDLLLRVEGAGPPAARRQWALSGLPDSVTDQLLATGVKGAFTSSPAFKQLINQITANAWCIRKKTANGPPATYSAITITRIDPIMVRNRKRGRPFELFRGRRLA